MAKLNTLLIHPDPSIRAELREMLQGVDFLQVLGEAVTAFEALELLEAIPYGVFFLAADLPQGVSGFELAQMISGRKNKPALIYIAEDEAKAFNAFELGASDYLLWPPARDRFKLTLDRLRAFKAGFNLVPDPEESFSDTPGHHVPGNEKTLKLPLGEEEQEQFLTALRQAWDHSKQFPGVEIEKLAINQDGKTILVPYNQVIFVEAYEDYSYVHTANQKFLTSYRLKILEDRLRQHRFFRVHRKYLVNLDMVTEIASLPGSNFMLRTAGRTRIELPISRRRISELKQILGL